MARVWYHGGGRRLLLGRQQVWRARRRNRDQPGEPRCGPRRTQARCSERRCEAHRRRHDNGRCLLLGRQQLRPSRRRHHHRPEQPSCGARRDHVCRGQRRSRPHVGHPSGWTGPLLGLEPLRAAGRRHRRRQVEPCRRVGWAHLPCAQRRWRRGGSHVRLDFDRRGVLLGRWRIRGAWGGPVGFSALHHRACQSRGTTMTPCDEETSMTLRRLVASIIVAALTVTHCSDRPTPAAPGPIRHPISTDMSQPQRDRHVVVFAAERVPADFPARVAALGGSVAMSLDSIGVTAVIGLTDTAAAQLATAPDVKAVEPDPLIGISGEQLEPADTTGDLASSAALAAAEPSGLPTSAPFYPRQWNVRAVFADQAWAAGQTGSRDVVVAVLDAGIDYLHPDLVGLVDLVRSKSFVPEEDVEVAARFPGRLAISDLNYHGTAIASIIASNGKVVAGINQHVTLLAVKIWNRSLVGPASRFLAGLVYAADQGADVINVSGEYSRDKSDSGGVAAAFNRATNYAFRKGALLVSVAGNDTTYLDHDGDRVRFPCQSPHAICASGTGPAGADGINGPWHDVDARAPDSAYGRSAHAGAAPRGCGRPIPQSGGPLPHAPDGDHAGSGVPRTPAPGSGQWHQLCRAARRRSRRARGAAGSREPGAEPRADPPVGR